MDPFGMGRDQAGGKERDSENLQRDVSSRAKKELVGER